MAESALRNLIQSDSRVHQSPTTNQFEGISPTWYKQGSNYQEPQLGQAVSDILGGVSAVMGPVPGLGDVAGLASPPCAPAPPPPSAPARAVRNRRAPTNKAHSASLRNSSGCCDTGWRGHPRRRHRSRRPAPRPSSAGARSRRC